MKSSIRALMSSALLACCTLIGAPAHADWPFSPTEAEWASWPMYCRAQYSWVNADFSFQYHYGGTVPWATVDHWRQVIGERAFTGMHHWCASMHYLDRARREPDPQKRDFLLSRASEDALFSYGVTDSHSPVYPNMTVTVAQIRDAMGKPDEARAVLQKGIQAQPKRSEPYVMLAMMHRKLHKLSEAREVLRQADELTEGTSAEIKYNLGLINFEQGDVAAARANARAAYRLGYPLPGLKNKLRAKGQWTGEDEASISSPAIARAKVSADEPPPQADSVAEPEKQ